LRAVATAPRKAGENSSRRERIKKAGEKPQKKTRRRESERKEIKTRELAVGKIDRKNMADT